MILAAAAAVVLALAAPAKPWQAAAAKLSMPVLAPATAPLGLKLLFVKPVKLTSCGPIKEQLTARYKSATREVFIVEGKPRVCGDIGEAKQVGKPKVHGRTGTLFDYGPGAYLLLWFERGIQLGVQTQGLSKAQVVAVANSLKLVPG